MVRKTWYIQILWAFLSGNLVTFTLIREKRLHKNLFYWHVHSWLKVHPSGLFCSHSLEYLNLWVEESDTEFYVNVVFWETPKRNL